MQCPSCQHENLDGAKFCNECAHKLELVCPGCGQVNPPGSKFCNECAHDLRQPVETHPIDYSKPQSYTPKHLKDRILTTRSSIEGERKLVTVFFADVANHTSMSEKLDPEEVHQIMDGCFKILMDEIHKYEGTINQFTGDGVMALFGAPVAHEDHAQRACYAALSIQKTLTNYEKNIRNKYEVDFKMRIGLNSGPVIVGSIGDDLRMDYTADGDITNLASRMESAASPGRIFVSKNTHRLVKDFFEFEASEMIKVKGKDALQEAYELIKAREIDTRFRAAVVKGLTPFVGRKNSLPALLEVYEKAKSGAGQIVGIVGEAGVGKSRINLEFRNRIVEDDVTYLEGRCIHFGGSMAYLPLLDILRFYYEIKEGDREYIIKKKIRDKSIGLDEKLKNVISPFQDLLSLKVDDDEYAKFEPQQKRERTFEALRDLFICLSRDKILIIAIEDLHWIDKTTEDFLDYFFGWIVSSPILLVLVYRPEFTHHWGSKSYYNRIGLNQLTIKSSAELVRALLEGGEVAPELSELILSRAAGNPLFMEEMTHTLLENGSIGKKDNQYILARSVSDVQVPDTIQGIIAARMDRLEDNLKSTMQVASVIGRDFAFRVLQTITTMKENLKSYLLNLQGLEFIYEKSLFPELEYIFKHALTQEVAYNSLLLKRRKEIHEDIGDAIEELYSSRLEEFYEMLAYHYSRSENHEKTFKYMKLSGEKESGRYSNWESVGFYSKALDVLNHMGNNEKNLQAQIDIRLQMAMLMVRLSWPEDLYKILKEGEEIAKKQGDSKSLVAFYIYISSFSIFHGDGRLALNYAENTFREAEKIQDIKTMAISIMNLASAYTLTGEYRRLTDVCPDFLNLIEKNGKAYEFFETPFNIYSIICMIYGVSLGFIGDYEKGVPFFQKGLMNAKEIGDPYTLGYFKIGYAHHMLFKGDGKAVVEDLIESIKYCEEVNWKIGLGLGWSYLGYGYYLLGELNTAKEYIEKGLKINTDIGLEGMLSRHYWYLSMVYYDLENLEEAQNNAEKALNLSEKNNENLYKANSLIILGKILGKKRSDDQAQAETIIWEGISILEDFNLKPCYALGYFSIGSYYLDKGQFEKAHKHFKQAEELFRDMGMDYWLARTYATSAELYKKGGEVSKVKENLIKSIEILKECGADGWVVKYEKELAALS